jgi:PEP-CTERM motif
VDEVRGDQSDKQQPPRRVYALSQLLTVPTIPEPATVVLMALGLVGLGYARRRKLVT